MVVLATTSCSESELGDQYRSDPDPSESSQVETDATLSFVGTLPVLDGPDVADRENFLTQVSPDGRWVALRDIRTDRWCLQSLADEMTPGPCTENPEFGGRVEWAPDSSRILSQGAPVAIFGDADVWSLSVDGAEVNHTDDGIPVEVSRVE